MKRQIMLLIISCAVLTTLIIGCASSNLNAEDSNYDIDRFFVKTVEYVMCNEYIICYKKANGEIKEIINMGISEQRLIIVHQRIFLSTGYTLLSVDFDGKDETVCQINPDDDIIFENITSADDEWLYCDGRKRVEIYGDPVALDGSHYILAKFKVKVDFSEYSEVL